MHSIGRVALHVLKFAMYLTWALAALCILFYESLSLYDPLAHFLGLDRFLDDASAVNARGDEVAAETKRSDISKSKATIIWSL